MRSRSRQRGAGVALAFLTLLALALRCYGIGRLDFWYDEIVLWEYSLTGNVLFVPTEAPLMSWLMFGVMWWMRSADALLFHLVPAVLGTLAVLLTYALVWKVGGSRLSSLAGAALITLSPMAIHYSREARPYALFILLSAATYGAFYWARRTKSPWGWPTFSLLMFLCALTHLLTAHLVLVVAIYSTVLLLRRPLEFDSVRRRLPLFVKSAFFTSLGWSAGTLWFLHRYRTDPAFDTTIGKVLDQVYPHGLLAFGRDVAVNLGGGASGSQLGLPWALSDLVGVISVLLVITGIAWLTRERRVDLLLLLGLALTVPLVIEYLVLGWKGSFDWFRYLSHALIPFLTLLALGIGGVLERARAPLAVGLVALLLLTIYAPQSTHYVNHPEYENYRGIATHLRDNRNQLVGVLIPPTLHHTGFADRRITHIYHYLKREDLPVYLFVTGTLHSTVLEPSRRGITEVARPGDSPVSNLPSGRYAILVRRPFESCDEVPSWIEGLSVEAGNRSEPVPGLVVCDLEFEALDP